MGGRLSTCGRLSIGPLPGFLVALTFLPTPAQPAAWIRLTTPTSELLTDTPERSARETLARLSRIESLFATHPTQPLRIFLFSSEKEFRDFAPSPTAAGFFQTGRERDYIVLHAGASPERVIAHEYIHALLNRSPVPLPLWFEEGTAEFYSTVQFPRGNLLVGTPIPAHLATLASAPWLDSATLSAVAPRVLDERTRSGVFYAQSWALVHMLNLAPNYRPGTPRFAELLASGSDPTASFEQAFGRPLERALSDLRNYVRQVNPAALAGPATPPATAAAGALTAVDAQLARADLALSTNHPDAARRWFQRIAQEHPSTAEAESAQAQLALLDSDRSSARAHVEKALALDSSNAALWFEFAQLEHESGAPLAHVDELLRRAASLQPDFAEARFLLGVHSTDDGNYSEAIAHLQAAVHVRTHESTYWYALAFALDRAGRKSEASAAASRALRTAATQDEENMAGALFNSLQ